MVKVFTFQKAKLVYITDNKGIPNYMQSLSSFKPTVVDILEDIYVIDMDADKSVVSYEAEKYSSYNTSCISSFHWTLEKVLSALEQRIISVQ